MRLMRLLPLFLLTSLAQAQTPVPIASHVLTAGKPAHRVGSIWTLSAVAPQPVIAMGSDRSVLFALLPQEERHWELQMLTGWETASPSIRSLSFEGDDSLDKLDFMSVSLLPTPDGKTMLVRIFIYNLHRYERTALILIIDLQEFRVLSRRVMADPLVANSRWFFGGAGELVAVEGPSPAIKTHDNRIDLDVFDMNPMTIGDHEAALLSLPELTPTLKCSYSVASGILSDRDAQLKNNQCEDFLRRAGVTSIFGLAMPPDGRTPLPYANRLGCRLQSVSAGNLHKLFTCYGGTNLNGDLRIKTRVAQVESDTGNVVFGVPVGEYEKTSGTLATLNGRDYLLLLRTGLKLEVYALP